MVRIFHYLEPSRRLSLTRVVGRVRLTFSLGAAQKKSSFDKSSNTALFLCQFINQFHLIEHLSVAKRRIKSQTTVKSAPAICIDCFTLHANLRRMTLHSACFGFHFEFKALLFSFSPLFSSVLFTFLAFNQYALGSQPSARH